MRRTAMTQQIARVGLGLLGAFGALALGACRGEPSDSPPRQFIPDMDDQPKYKAQSRSTFYKEFYDPSTDEWFGRSMREPVAGTVAFGARPFAARFEGTDWAGHEFAAIDFAERERYLREDDAVYEGKAADGKYIEYMPIAVTPELIALGRDKYQVFCLMCHGGLGDGKGPVGERWSYPLPSWHQAQYYHGGEKGQDGYLYHTIRYGVPNTGGVWDLKMPAYGSKMTEHDSWAIVAYLRVLQKSQNGRLEDLPDAERLRLEREGGPRAASAVPSSPVTSTQESAS